MQEPDSPELINFAALRNWIAFAWAATRRRKRLVALVCFSIMGLAGASLLVLPKTYRVECKLLAQRNSVLAIRGDQSGGESNPTRAAADLVLRREKIIDLMRRTDLLKEWQARREPVYRLKDWVMQAISGPPTEKQRIDGLADYLASRMGVMADETTVTIRVDWRSPELAYRLVDAAQTSFLEARHVREVSTLAESVSILEGRASDILGEIDTAVNEIKRLRSRREKEEHEKTREASAASRTARGPAAAPRPVIAPAPVASEEAPPPGPSREEMARIERRLSELPVMIESKERTINEMEGFRLRRVAELQARLQEQKAVYTSAHPAVADIEQAIAASSRESSQVTHLRTEAKQLRAELDQLRTRSSGVPLRTTTQPMAGSGMVGSGPAPRSLGDVIRIEQESAEERDPEVEYARSRLRFAIHKYESLQDEIGRTRVDLATAEAAFKYRYTMVMPPEMPRGPKSPKAALILVAALMGGLALGLVGAIGMELREGVIHDPWLVEARLALPVLGVVRLPRAEGLE